MKRNVDRKMQQSIAVNTNPCFTPSIKTNTFEADSSNVKVHMHIDEDGPSKGGSWVDILSS